MKPRTVSDADIVEINRALIHLRAARDMLTRAGARNAADAARRAMKSAEGARRHVEGVSRRQLESLRAVQS
jgi:Xaa-Pro aminopeptidase